MNLEFELKGHASPDALYTDFVSRLPSNGGSATMAATMLERLQLKERIQVSWPDLATIGAMLEMHLEREVQLQTAGQAELRGHKASANWRQIRNRQGELKHLEGRIRSLRVLLS